MKNYKTLSWLIVAMLVMATSCENKEDEPGGAYSYYMTIQSQVELQLHEEEDESQGTMTDGKNEVLSKTIVNMKKALAAATSEQNSRQVNDAAAMKVCDSIYNGYATAYAEKKGITVCIVKIIRSKMVDGQAHDGYTLRTYNFWSVDVEPDPKPTDKIEKPEILAQVDLGLSVMWANCNLGAKTVEGYGVRYAWGDPTGKLWSADGIGWKNNAYTWNTDNYGGKNPPADISGTTLDIVAMNWGDGWRMPTYDEAKELCEKCQWKLQSRGDIKWYEVIGPNGNSIIMPLAGSYGDDLSQPYNRFHTGPYGVNESGYYWTSTICPTPATAETRGYGISSDVATAWDFYFKSAQGDMKPMFIDDLRAYHMSIRPVHNK